jgi:hypothetical protein
MRGRGSRYDLEPTSIAFALHGDGGPFLDHVQTKLRCAEVSKRMERITKRSDGAIRIEEHARGIGWISSTNVVTALVGGDFRLQVRKFR